MIFDVMIRENFKNNGKQIINVVRVHDSELSKYLRMIQDSGKYIISVIPLFRSKTQESIVERNIEGLLDGSKYLKSMSLSLDKISVDRIPDISETYLRKDIDPRLLKTVSYVPIDSIGE